MEASVQIARGHPDYGGLVDRVNAMVTAIVPSSETVLVVSKGDESLLRLGSRRGWHFPRSPDGRYRTEPLRALWETKKIHKGGFYHDGRFSTLQDVVSHYNRVMSLGLTPAETQDLIDYLKSL